MHHVAHAVELGALATAPELPEGHGIPVPGVAGQGLGNHGKGAACSREAGIFGEGAELDGAVPGPLHFKNGVGQLRILDKGFVSRIKENQGFMAAGIVNPTLQICTGSHRPGGIVGEAQIDDIRRRCRQGGAKVVVRGEGQVLQAAVAPLIICGARMAGHHVGVHVDGVDRIGHRNAVVVPEDVQNVAGVALGAIGDENLVRFNGTAPLLVIMLGDGLP